LVGNLREVVTYFKVTSYPSPGALTARERRKEAADPSKQKWLPRELKSKALPVGTNQKEGNKRKRAVPEKTAVLKDSFILQLAVYTEVLPSIKALQIMNR
jgi:hypothetical protein